MKATNQLNFAKSSHRFGNEAVLLNYVLRAVHLSIHAWNDVQETTITKAFQFQHTGFTTVIEESQDNVPVYMSEEELLIKWSRQNKPTAG